tara:strand:+ start:2310 stop:2753 length:444 start_codon:yes stop_codon:yes gene_type:complete
MVSVLRNSWYYKDVIFTSDDIGDNYGFVYLITDLTNDKMYLGKKFFWSKRRLPPLKGKKNKRNKIVESDWVEYFGSSEEVKRLVEDSGRERFKREILVLCKSKGECSYWEAKLQFEYDVLLKDEYYNEFIGCKIHSAHVKKLKDNYK